MTRVSPPHKHHLSLASPSQKTELGEFKHGNLPSRLPTGGSSLQNTFWPGSISVLNDLPTVCTLFLHPPQRSTQPFSSSNSRKELYIRPLIVSLTLFCNTFKSFRHPPPQKKKRRPTKWILWANRQTFSQIPKHGSLLLLRRSSVDLGCASWKKVYDKKDASKLGRRGWKGSRVRANLN